MPTQKDAIDPTGGEEELPGSGFEDEQPDRDFADPDQPQTEDAIQ